MTIPIAAEHDIDHIDVGNILRNRRELDIADADTVVSSPSVPRLRERTRHCR
jgi:hypothetical protein